MKKRRIIGKTVFLLILLCCIVLLNSFAIGNETVKYIVTSFGYTGMFFIAVLSGFNLAIPIPAIGFYPLFVEHGFSSVLIIATISCGMVFGDGIGYLIGSTGREVMSPSRVEKISTWVHTLKTKHRFAPYILVCMYAAFVPLPNELLVIPMAFAGYRFLPMVAMLFIGNVFFNMLGAVGIANLVSLF